MTRSALLSILLASMLAACASDKPKEQPKAVEQPVAQPAAAVQAEVDPLDDPNSILAKRSVYYPFDISVVQSEDRALVEAHAQYLAAHSGVSVRIEGNCDERGSNEYNLGLGQRRADGVKKMLLAGGASAGQITTMSHGEEKPRESCHAEKCWQENRRSDILYSR